MDTIHQSAKHIQQQNFANSLEASDILRVAAGGIDTQGAQRALAQASSVIQKAHEETISNTSIILKRGNLDDDRIVQLALGYNQPGLHGELEATNDMQEAAIRQIASGGNVGALMEMMRGMMDRPNDQHRIALVETLKSNNLRPKFVGFGAMSAIAQHTQAGGQAGIDSMIQGTMNANKFTAEALIAQLDDDGAREIFDTLSRNGAGFFDPQALQAFGKQIYKVYTDDDYNGRIGERDPHLRNIAQALGVQLPPR